MSPALTALDLAAHWPFLRENLLLDRRPAISRALELVAESQVYSGGEPAALGRARIREAAGLTPGEAGATWRALRDLERAGALATYTGGGRRPSLWTLEPELARWRGVPWRTSARTAELAILACPCRARFALAARVPGHGLAHLPNSPQFAAFDDPARLGIRASIAEPRAANANSRAWRPVDSRGYGAPAAASLNSSKELIVPIGKNPEEEERVEKLKKAAEARTRQTFAPRCRPLRSLEALALRLTDRQVTALLRELEREPGDLYIPKVVNVLEDLATGRAVKMAGRSDDGAGGGHFYEFDAIEA